MTSLLQKKIEGRSIIVIAWNIMQSGGKGCGSDSGGVGGGEGQVCAAAKQTVLVPHQHSVNQSSITLPSIHPMVVIIAPRARIRPAEAIRMGHPRDVTIHAVIRDPRLVRVAVEIRPIPQLAICHIMNPTRSCPDSLTVPRCDFTARLLPNEARRAAAELGEEPTAGLCGNGCGEEKKRKSNDEERD